MVAAGVSEAAVTASADAASELRARAGDVHAAAARPLQRAQPTPPSRNDPAVDRAASDKASASGKAPKSGKAPTSHKDTRQLGADAELPAILEASEPPEARGLRRDEVRLLVSNVARDTIEHARFHDLPRWLSAGDLLVVNTSGTLNAALQVQAEAGEPFELHLSTRLPDHVRMSEPFERRPSTRLTDVGMSQPLERHLSTPLPNDVRMTAQQALRGWSPSAAHTLPDADERWVVELRRLGPVASLPYREALAGLTLRLPADARATLLAPYPLTGDLESPSRLWIAALRLPPSVPLHAYLDRHGAPIRYSYVRETWPASMYQTMFAREMGSAEMPSAGRPFTPAVAAQLAARGVRIAPLLLHTGVASLEDHEPPYEEFYRVPPETARLVNDAHRAGRRVIAVGTTVVRALETVTDASGITHAGEGWTGLVITRDRPLRAVNGLMTGLHEPRATHLAILERVIATAADVAAAPTHLTRAYDEARRAGYLWHEFGDSHLIV